MWDTTNKRLGIGTAAPAGTLDVEGGTATSGNGTNMNVYAQNGTASGTTNGGNILLMPGSANGGGAAGEVGVGSTAPLANIDVSGSIKVSDGDKLAMTPMSGCSAITRVPRSFRFATSSDVDTGKTILRDYIKATVGFDKLSQATKTPSKSLIRMFGPNGNPQAKNLFNVPGYLQKQAGIELRVIFD